MQKCFQHRITREMRGQGLKRFGSPLSPGPTRRWTASLTRSRRPTRRRGRTSASAAGGARRRFALVLTRPPMALLFRKPHRCYSTSFAPSLCLFVRLTLTTIRSCSAWLLCYRDGLCEGNGIHSYTFCRDDARLQAESTFIVEIWRGLCKKIY
jgi:hypothetical protein